MGGCFKSQKPQLDDVSTSVSIKSEKNIGTSSISPIPGGPSTQIGSSPDRQVTNLNNIQKDIYKIDLVDVNSQGLANLIAAKDGHAMSKRLFSWNNSLLSSNFSRLSTGSSQEKGAWVNEMSWTQHIRLHGNQHPSMILPTIYIGSKEDSTKAARLQEIGITHILCVTGGKERKLDGCKLLTVVMADNGNSQLEDIMNMSFQFIEESQQKGNKLLVHCESGQNRSPTILIAWLMCKMRWSFYRAYKYVKEAREMIKPHKLYLDQLRTLDKRLFGIYSTPDDYLSMSFSDGKLTFGQESITATERSAYASRQIIEMTPPELATYHSKLSWPMSGTKTIHNTNYYTKNTLTDTDNETQSPNI